MRIAAVRFYPLWNSQSADIPGFADFLPSQTFTRLLARYGSRLPAPLLAPLSNSSVTIDGSGPADAEKLAQEALDSLNSRWVLKVRPAQEIARYFKLISYLSCVDSTLS